VFETIAKVEEHKIKPFKLRRPVVVGERQAGFTIPWQALLVFCAIVIRQVLWLFCAMIIIVSGIIAWFYPWFCLPVACIAITIIIFFGVFASLSVSSKIKRLFGRL
jgi:hypothetical protein